MKTRKIDLEKLTVGEAIVWNHLLEHNYRVLKDLREQKVKVQNLKRIKL